MKKKVLITGSGGLIGSAAVRFFSGKGFDVIGIDNDMRKTFFGASASVSWNVRRLTKDVPRYRHFNVDIRDSKNIEQIFRSNTFNLIIHAASQPSHDWAAREPITDFTINANGTLNLLENFRKYAPRGVFIFTSTNKVYGDTPNTLPFIELKTRYELKKSHAFYKGINESMTIDQSKHSLFGVSKASADILVQEYGRYFGLKTVSFRCGCLTGPAHSSTELHGFLAYLAACIAKGKTYTIFGYKGKQVRDNMHAYDIVNAMYHFYLKPKRGEVYNMGGGRFSNISILEAVEKLEKISGKKAKTKFVRQSRAGDHIWYISDISKFQRDYPGWILTHNIDSILDEICKFGHFQEN